MLDQVIARSQTCAPLMMRCVSDPSRFASRSRHGKALDRRFDLVLEADVRPGETEAS